MGSDAVYLQTVTGHPFSRCLVGPGQTLGGFEHKDRCAFFGQRFRQRPGMLAAGLLVAVEQKDHRPGQPARFRQQLQRGKRHHHAALHVQDAGTPCPAAAQTEGHLLERAQGKDGVQMAQQHQGLGLCPGRPEAADQQVTGRSLPLAPALAAAGFDPPLHQGYAAVDRRPVFRGGFDAHQLGYPFQHLRPGPGHCPGQVTVGLHALSSSFPGIIQRCLTPAWYAP